MLRRCLALTFAVLGFSALAFAQNPPQSRDTVLVLDVSGSMWGRIEDKPKIEIARAAAARLVDALPPRTRLGVVAYGHRRPGDCADIETVLPVAAVDRGRLESTLQRLVPRGKTPITEALREAAKVLDAERKGGTIILVTDGIETCKGDPCALAGELKKRNVNLTAHVIGFDIGNKADQAKLACIAERTGGTFVAAGNAGELGAALQRTAQSAPKPVAQTRRIALKATDGGRAVSGANFSILKTADEAPVFDGVTDAIELAPGNYTVAAATAIKNGAVQVEVTARAPAEIMVPLTGTLPKASVRPTAPSAIATTEFTVAWEGPDRDGDYITVVPADGSELEERDYAWVRDANPVKLRVPGDPGAYEVHYVLGQPRTVLARAKLTVTPATATLAAADSTAAGSMIEVRWSGPKSEGDYISVAAAGAPSGEYVNYQYAPQDGAPVRLQMPGTAGAYELRYVTGHEAKVLARRPITVGKAEATVSGPAQAGAGQAIDVTWTGPGGEGDYVSVALASHPASEYVSYAYASQPTLRLQMPGKPGAYELRYVQSAPDGSKVLARQPINVGALTASVSGPAKVMASYPIEMTWTGPGGESDYVTIAAPSQPTGDYVTYAYTREPTLRMRAPTKPGAYELRYVQNAPEGDRVLVRTPLVVEPAKVSIEAPARIRRGAQITVRFDGPKREEDFIAIANSSSGPGEYETFGYANADGSVTFESPQKPGAYELRYVASAEEQAVLARRPLRVD